MQAVIAKYNLIKMTGEPSVHRAKGDRLVGARVLPVYDNAYVTSVRTRLKSNAST